MNRKTRYRNVGNDFSDEIKLYRKKQHARALRSDINLHASIVLLIRIFSDFFLVKFFENLHKSLLLC